MVPEIDADPSRSCWGVCGGRGELHLIKDVRNVIYELITQKCCSCIPTKRDTSTIPFRELCEFDMRYC